LWLGKNKDLEFDLAEMKQTYFLVEFEKDVAKELLGKHLDSLHWIPVRLAERMTSKRPKREWEALSDVA
jgi:hypothetical protein